MTNRICPPEEFARAVLDALKEATKDMTDEQKDEFIKRWAYAVGTANGFPPEEKP